MILFDTDYLNQLYYSCWYLKKCCDMIVIWLELDPEACEQYYDIVINTQPVTFFVTHKCNQKHENFIKLSENCKCYIPIGNSTKKIKIVSFLNNVNHNYIFKSEFLL